MLVQAASPFRKQASNYLKVLTIQPLNPPDSAQGKGESIAAWSPTMSLSRKGGGCRSARRLHEARRRGRKAHVPLGEVQFSSIVPSSIVVLVALCCVGGRDGQLGVDLVEGRLGVRKTELAPEQ